MQKKTLLKKINELGEALGSKKASEAIETLKKELESYIEPTKKEVASISDFKLPVEVSNNSSAFALYTDGACRGNPGPGSYAFMVQNSSGEIIFEDADYENYTTNNKMELSAIIEGLKVLKPNVSPMHSIYVFTDSKYVVDGMRSWVDGWKKRGWKKADKKAPENLDLWQALDELATIARVEFHWVKGHSGHPQNEYVDQLANKVLDKNGF